MRSWVEYEKSFITSGPGLWRVFVCMEANSLAKLIWIDNCPALNIFCDLHSRKDQELLKKANFFRGFRVLGNWQGHGSCYVPPPKGRGTYCFWVRSRWRMRERDTFLSARYLMNYRVDFNQIWMDITLGQDEELIRFWWPWPYFQGHSCAKYVKFRPKFCCVQYISWTTEWILIKFEWI